MFCPLVNRELRVEMCPTDSCQFNRNGDCQHNEMTLPSQPPEDYLIKNNLLGKATKMKHKIAAYFYADKYVQWATAKPLYMMKADEVTSVLDPERFKSWPLAVPKYQVLVQKVIKQVYNEATPPQSK